MSEKSEKTEKSERFERLSVFKTYKLYVGGKFPRSESGRVYEVSRLRVSDGLIVDSLGRRIPTLNITR